MVIRTSLVPTCVHAILYMVSFVFLNGALNGWFSACFVFWGSNNNISEEAPYFLMLYVKSTQNSPQQSAFRSVMTILAAVYRRMRPDDPRDFVQDSWTSGRRTSLRRTSFSSY